MGASGGAAAEAAGATTTVAGGGGQGMMGYFLAQLGSTLFALSPVLGYLPQYLKTRAGAEGFSAVVPLILLSSNIVRCFFWLGRRFDVTLLVQAFIMIAVQLLLLRALVQVRAAKTAKDHTGRGAPWTNPFMVQHFWQWDTFSPYLLWLALLVLALAGSSAVALRYDWFVELLGTLACSVEALIAVPQAIQNYRRRDTSGLSVVMIVGWLGGDSCKLLYYLQTSAPVHFTFSAIFQLATDVFVLIQIVLLYPTKEMAAMLKKWTWTKRKNSNM